MIDPSKRLDNLSPDLRRAAKYFSIMKAHIMIMIYLENI